MGTEGQVFMASGLSRGLFMKFGRKIFNLAGIFHIDSEN